MTKAVTIRHLYVEYSGEKNWMGKTISDVDISFNVQ